MRVATQMLPNELEPIEIVKCFECNSELSTKWSELQSGRHATCPGCGQDLRPHHTDPGCGLCNGKGAFRANGVIWICSNDRDDAGKVQGKPPANLPSKLTVR